MHKQMTVTLDEAVYEGLCQRIGRGRISQFIEDLVRPHVLGTPPYEDCQALEESYRAMAADQRREAAAQEWGNALIGDVPDASW